MISYNESQRRTQYLIDEMEADTDNSRSQSFLEEFWQVRRELEDARDATYGKEKSAYSKLLDLLNRKGEEYDLEPY